MDPFDNVNALPKPGEMWKRPPKAPSGDPSPDPIHLAVGRALTTWENLENYYASVFARLVLGDGGFGEGAKRAYGAMRDTQSRSWAIRAAADVYFAYYPDADLEQQLQALRKHYLEACEWRNEIAHGHCSGLQDRGYFLIPGLNNPMKTDSWMAESWRSRGKPSKAADDPLAQLYFNYRYTSGDITEFATRCAKLRNAAIGFDMRLTMKIADARQGARGRTSG